MALVVTGENPASYIDMRIDRALDIALGLSVFVVISHGPLASVRPPKSYWFIWKTTPITLWLRCDSRLELKGLSGDYLLDRASPRALANSGPAPASSCLKYTKVSFQSPSRSTMTSAQCAMSCCW